MSRTVLRKTPFAARTAAVLWLACAAGAGAGSLTVDDLTGYGRLTLAREDATSIPTNGLLFRYGFTENNGSTVLDESGHAVTGTVYGAAAWTNSARIGGGMIFDGINDTVKGRAQNNINRYFSVAGWIKPNANVPGVVLQQITSWGSTLSDASRCRIFVYWGTTGRVEFFIRTKAGRWNDYDGYSVITSNAFSTDWHHLVCVRTNAMLKVYVDGIEEPTYVSTDYGYSANQYDLRDISTSDPNTYLATLRSGSMYYYASTLDEVMLYNRSVSPAEVRQLFRYGNPGPEEAGTAIFGEGIRYTKGLSDVSMGCYTNTP